MLPAVSAIEPARDETATRPRRAPWTTPALRMLDAGDAEFGPNTDPEGSIGQS